MIAHYGENNHSPLGTSSIPCLSLESLYNLLYAMSSPHSPTQQKYLIVNADDLGESISVNTGILKAHTEGIVTSASLLSNMPGFEHACSLIRENPSLDVGVHLNMHRGVPLTNPTHLARGGRFLHSTHRFLLLSYTNRERAREEITREFDAQIQRVLQAGVRISHLDTEKHLHTLPLVFSTVLNLAKKYRIPSVRLPFETLTFRTLTNPTQLHKVLIMGLFAPKNRQLLKESGLASTDRFRGVTLSKHFRVPNILRFLAEVPPGTTELSCHPGYVTKGENYIDAHREAELRVLTAPEIRRAVTENGIVLSTFADIR